MLKAPPQPAGVPPAPTPSEPRAGHPHSSAWPLLGLSCLLLWTAALVFFARYEMLDDALIHLRYAAMLRQHGFLTYDGVRRSYGPSSLLYVSLLALLRGLTRSSLLPKAVSVLAYSLLLLVLLLVLRRVRGSTAAQTLALGLLLALCAPMGVRWLSDGMETSLVLLLSALLALAASRAADRHYTSMHAAALFALGLLAVLLRVELALLVLVATCSVTVTVLTRSHAQSQGQALLRALPLGSGGAVALLAVRVTMGHLLPDTAVAKAGLPPAVVLFTMLHILGSAYSLGVGMALLWAVSAVLVLRPLAAGHSSLSRALPPALWRALVPNSAFPLLYAAAVVRGQGLQSVRYVLWTLLLSTVWNVLELRRLELSKIPVRDPRAAAAPQRALLSAALVTLCFVACWAVETPVFFRIVAGRTRTLLTLRGQNLGRLAGQTGIAADVGFIGYFSRAEICDLAGLVNGRAFALQPPEARARACAARHPAFAFLSASQMDGLAPLIDWRGWDACESVDFTNAGSDDRHWLLLRRAPGQPTCSEVMNSAAARAPAGDDGGRVDRVRFGVRLPPGASVNTTPPPPAPRP